NQRAQLGQEPLSLFLRLRQDGDNELGRWLARSLCVNELSTGQVDAIAALGGQDRANLCPNWLPTVVIEDDDAWLRHSKPPSGPAPLRNAMCLLTSPGCRPQAYRKGMSLPAHAVPRNPHCTNLW